MQYVTLDLKYFKRKPPCIGGMELVSLSCNRVFISAESVGRGWCKIAIATKWYQFHTTDKCGFLFMPWITDQYTFVRYTTLVNKIGTAVAKVNTFSIMTTSYNIHSVRHAAPPHPEQKLRAIFHVQNWNGFPVISMHSSMQSKNKWLADDVLRSVKGEFLPKSDLSC